MYSNEMKYHIKIYTNENAFTLTVKISCINPCVASFNYCVFKIEEFF